MKWFLRLSLVINVCFALMASCGYLASYLHPKQSSLVQSMGLFMPWLLLINLIFLCFWITLRKKWWWLSALPLILGLSQIGRFVGLHFQQESDASQIAVCTYNSKSYNESEHLKVFLQDLQNEYHLDILCLQEISESHQSEVMQSSGLTHAHFHKGKMILSRYPILAMGNIQFDASVNGCLWIDIMFQDRRIRIYNAHLHSNRITREAETILDNIKSDKAQAWNKMKHMVSNYARASKVRIEQVNKILQHIRQCDYPVLFAGDFNDTPFSYTYQQVDNELNDVFREKGLGFGSTYAGALPGLKIDYIFADENFEGLSHQILRTKISDHFPVLSLLKYKN